MFEAIKERHSNALHKHTKLIYPG